MGNTQVEGNVVLVVDDDDINLQVAKMVLEKKLPCRVITVDNGVQGLEILRRQYVRVVLLDIMMPYFDGIETLKEIRADKKLKDIPVMMLTASTEKTNIRQAMELGVKDYIRKPFLPAELIERVGKKLVMKSDSAVSKILIIDDDENNLKSLKKILENHFPHEVLTANSGINGMEVLRSTEVNLVVANTAMRFINGFRILEFMRREEKTKNVPAFLVAPASDLDTLAKIRLSDAKGFLTTPFEDESIVKTLTEVFS